MIDKAWPCTKYQLTIALGKHVSAICKKGLKASPHVQAIIAAGYAAIMTAEFNCDGCICRHPHVAIDR